MFDTIIIVDGKLQPRLSPAEQRRRFDQTRAEQALFVELGRRALDKLVEDNRQLPEHIAAPAPTR